MSDSNGMDGVAWSAMAELAVDLPEVPISMLEAVARICIEPELDERIMRGFDFVSNINNMKLITLMIESSGDSGSIVDFSTEYTGDRPKFSKYGFRLDTVSEEGETEEGNPVLASDMWIGVYDLTDQFGLEDVGPAFRMICKYNDEEEEPTELWFSKEDGKLLAQKINVLINKYDRGN